MGISSHSNHQRSGSAVEIRADDPIRLEADVLVLGGGPAGAWAAWSAASHGARVILADKGYLGSSGATAPGGTNVLYLPPDPDRRHKAVEDRMAMGGFLSERKWIHRVLDTVYESLKLVEEWGYPFPPDENGHAMRNHIQGPEYMKLMRKVVKKAGATILDQSPALELLADEDGVGGARGVSRLDGRPWEVRANAVVIATGGCAFLSKALGCDVNTGDGLLMSAEVGAELSGMEFSSHYAPVTVNGSVTRGLMLGWATITAEDGTVLNPEGFRDPELFARALLRGPVYGVLDRADTEKKREMLRRAHAIFFLPLDRAGIDPFVQRFPITLRYEGTVRGTGGIRLTGEDCSALVGGLYAAGDAASREPVTGGRSGGGAFNAAWAICSGQWSGEAAAAYSRTLGFRSFDRRLKGAGRAGIRSDADTPRTVRSHDIVQAVQNEVFPLDINYFRSEPVLNASLERLQSIWTAVKAGQPEPTAQDWVRSRQAASMTAAARWMYSAALSRRETRGMHRMKEYPDTDPAQRHRLTVSGIDSIEIRPQEPETPASIVESLLKREAVLA